MTEVIDMCQKIKDKRLYFVLNPDNVWDKFDNSLKAIVKSEWKEVKFLDDNGEKLHTDMNKLPNDYGGIYVFVLKPEIIPKTHMYILYIGRCKYTTHQNLRKRCCEYFNEKSRPKISAMIHLWGKYLYIRYLPLKDNGIIKKLEDELIRTIYPPCNDKYPDRVTRMAMKAAF